MTVDRCDAEPELQHHSQTMGITHPTLPGKPDKAQKVKVLTLNTIPLLEAGWVLPPADVLVQVMTPPLWRENPDLARRGGHVSTDC